MQRKNYLLRNTRLKFKRGIAMIMAIAVIVIIATIMALSLAMTAETTKKTTDLYLYEQAVLLSNSAAEYALLRIAEDGACSNSNLNFNPPPPLDYYDINITNRFVYNIPCATAAANYQGFVLKEEATNGTVLMDITVSIPTSKNVTTEPIRYFRRSLQKL
jgi:type II secretory pathway pseudopilin PulG